MASSPLPEAISLIDEVSQSRQSNSTPSHESQHIYSHSSNLGVNINRTPPLTRKPPTNDFSKDQRAKSIPLDTQKEWDEQQDSSSRGRPDKDTISTMRGTSEQSHQGSSRTMSVLESARGNAPNITDFFSSEVFQIVLHNPTTAHRFLRFCQSRACGENMEFLQKVDAYNRILDELATTLGSIHTNYTSANAPSQINISHNTMQRVSADLKQASQQTLPSLETIFIQAQEDVEKLLASDIYPRFVKHQITASATMALADHREKFAGLGDCFCLTDPHRADNPVVLVSDGFVSVTGYSRKDIIPRNCRFLQGKQSDPISTKRLRNSIEQCEETVELLLNYHKNGDPFWNLLYCSPLFNEKGEVSFFLGGQINCSTTIHSCNDVLRILSINDDELDQLDEDSEKKPTSARSRDSGKHSQRTRSSFFKSWRKYKAPVSRASSRVYVRDDAGMEGELLNRLGKMSFRTQVEAFYTAYSKYLVMKYTSSTRSLIVQHFSAGVIDLLCLNLPNGDVAPIHNKDIFHILAEHTSAPSSSATKALKQTVRDAIRAGKAVSVETGLLTGFAEKKGGSWLGGNQDGLRRVEEKYVTHWTPLKDEDGGVSRVVLTIAPKV